MANNQKRHKHCTKLKDYKQKMKHKFQSPVEKNIKITHMQHFMANSSN